MDTVGTKFVTYHYNHDATKVKEPFLPKAEWVRLAEDSGWFDELYSNYGDYLAEALRTDPAIDKIAGEPWRGLYIRYKTTAPRGYVHVSEYALARAGADELDYRSPKILRAWWD